MNRQAFIYLLASALTLALLVVPNAIAAGVDGSWQLESGGNIPAGSFVGGNTRTNQPIYICWAVLASDLKIVGRMISGPGGSPGPGCVYVMESEIIVKTDEYRVLEHHQKYAWQDWTGTLPEKPIKGGFGVGHNLLSNIHYICQAPSPDNPAALIPGKLRDRDKTCQIVYGKGPGGKRTIHETTSGFKILVRN